MVGSSSDTGEIVPADLLTGHDVDRQHSTDHVADVVTGQEIGWNDLSGV